MAGAERAGPFYRPTVLTGVRPEMSAFTEEICGPVAPVTTFDTDEEAVALVNGSPYGLAAAIHTRNVQRGLRIAQRLQTGGRSSPSSAWRRASAASTSTST